MKLRDYLSVVWRRRVLVLLAALIGAGVVWMVGQPSDPDAPTYSGDVTLTMKDSEPPASILLYFQIADRTTTISSAVAADLGEGFYGPGVSTLAQLELDVSVFADAEVGTMQVRAINQPTEEAAVRVLSGFAQELIDYAMTRRATERDEQLTSLQTRQVALLETIDSLTTELDEAQQALTEEDRAAGVVPDRLKAAQLESNVVILTQIEGEIDVLLNQSSEQLTPLTQLSEPYTLPDPLAVSPLDFTQRLIVGVALATLLGVGLAFALHKFDSRLYTRKETEAGFGLPVLTEVPRVRWIKRRKSGVLTRTEPASAVAEAFRLLRSSLAYTRLLQLERLGKSDDGQGMVTVVTSVSSSAGKSTTVANLAVAAVDAGKSVLVVGGDLRQPTIHRMLDAEKADGGITDAVRVLQNSGQLDLGNYLVPTAIEGVTLFGHGGKVPNPGETLAQLRAIIEAVRSYYDVILIDTPPMLAGNDVNEMIPFVDLVLLVARSGKTTIDEAEWADETASRLEAPTCGVALIGTRSGLEHRNGSLLSRLFGRGQDAAGSVEDRAIAVPTAKSGTNVVVAASADVPPPVAPALVAPTPTAAAPVAEQANKPSGQPAAVEQQPAAAQPVEREVPPQPPSATPGTGVAPAAPAAAATEIVAPVAAPATEVVATAKTPSASATGPDPTTDLPRNLLERGQPAGPSEAAEPTKRPDSAKVTGPASDPNPAAAENFQPNETTRHPAGQRADASKTTGDPAHKPAGSSPKDTVEPPDPGPTIDPAATTDLPRGLVKHVSSSGGVDPSEPLPPAALAAVNTAQLRELPPPAAKSPAGGAEPAAVSDPTVALTIQTPAGAPGVDDRGRVPDISDIQFGMVGADRAKGEAQAAADRELNPPEADDIEDGAFSIADAKTEEGEEVAEPDSAVKAKSATAKDGAKKDGATSADDADATGEAADEAADDEAADDKTADYKTADDDEADDNAADDKAGDDETADDKAAGDDAASGDEESKTGDGSKNGTSTSSNGSGLDLPFDDDFGDEDEVGGNVVAISSGRKGKPPKSLSV